MKKCLFGLALALSVCVWSAGRTVAQEGKKGEPKHGEPGHVHGDGEKGKKGEEPKKDAHAAGEEMPAPVTPSAEHKRLEAFVGTWKADGKMWMIPGQPPEISTGTSVVKPILNGLAVVDDYSGESASMPGFKGWGLTTWNQTTGKYQSLWMDTFSTNGAESFVGTYDEKANAYTFTGKMSCGPEGPMDVKMVHRWESKDKHVFEFFMPSPDGKEFKSMEIIYTRK